MIAPARRVGAVSVERGNRYLSLDAGSLTDSQASARDRFSDPWYHSDVGGLESLLSYLAEISIIIRDTSRGLLVRPLSTTGSDVDLESDLVYSDYIQTHQSPDYSV